MQKIVHISPDGIFIKDFIKFVENNFDSRSHHYFILHKKKDRQKIKGKNKYTIKYSMAVFYPSSVINILRLVKAIHQADKIILHGLNETFTIFLLFLTPWNLRKCYWFTWGSDLYKYQKADLPLKLKILYSIKKIIVKRLGFIVVAIKGEYRNIQKWFGTKGKLYRSFKYPSNFYKETETDIPINDDGITRILFGNSASLTNNHLEGLKLIKEKIPESLDYKLICPLSYGGSENAEKVMKEGVALFGENFVPIQQFMPLNEYLTLLKGIDIAIFNHYRQQGMGNIITLLGMGKKVFIREDITPWEFFNELGLKVYTINKLEFSKIEPINAHKNQEIIKNYFSRDRLKKELEGIFEERN